MKGFMFFMKLIEKKKEKNTKFMKLNPNLNPLLHPFVQPQYSSSTIVGLNLIDCF